jgi:hypothetical protein
MSADAVKARRALPPAVVDEVRRSVRGVLERAPAYAQATDDERRDLARGMVDLGLVAAGLADEERESAERLRKRRPLAAAQSAGDQLSMAATRAAAGTLTGLRDAIDFPNYVGSLITGVFQAILNSSVTQIGSLSDLVQNVGVSAEDYANSVDDSEVARWLVAKFPRLLVSPDGSSVQPTASVDLSEHTTELQKILGGGGDVTDPDALMDMGRQKMAADKQQVLATMTQLGLQRIVVDEGRIHASMDLRVDAQSGSAEAKAARDDWRVNAGASGSFGNGIWGASASASTSVGQVHSDSQLTNEQIGARAGLRSSVDLAFRTDQVPIDKVASRSARAHLAAASQPADVSGGSGILSSLPQNFAAPSLDQTGQAPAAPQTPPTRQPTGTPPQTAPTGTAAPRPNPAPAPQPAPGQSPPGQAGAGQPRPNPAPAPQPAPGQHPPAQPAPNPGAPAPAPNPQPRP